MVEREEPSAWGKKSKQGLSKMVVAETFGMKSTCGLGIKLRRLNPSHCCRRPLSKVIIVLILVVYPQDKTLLLSPPFQLEGGEQKPARQATKLRKAAMSIAKALTLQKSEESLLASILKEGHQLCECSGALGISGEQ